MENATDPAIVNPVATAQSCPDVMLPIAPVMLLERLLRTSDVASPVLNGAVLLTGNAPIAETKPNPNPMNIMKTHALMHRLLNVFILYDAPYIPRSLISIRIPRKIIITGKTPEANAFHIVGKPI